MVCESLDQEAMRSVKDADLSNGEKNWPWKTRGKRSVAATRVKGWESERTVVQCFVYTRAEVGYGMIGILTNN